jgi:hypothetical protein
MPFLILKIIPPFLGILWPGFFLGGFCGGTKHRFAASNHKAILLSHTQWSRNGTLLVKENQTYAAIKIKISNAPTLSRGFTKACTTLQVTHRYLITPASDRYGYKEATVCILEIFLKDALIEL